MSEMIERIKEILAGADCHPTHCSDYEWQARAVLEAMRVPTEAMVEAGASEHRDVNYDRSCERQTDVIEDIWPAMIDEALKTDSA